MAVAVLPTCVPGEMDWRHLRFLLLYSPRWLFLYPGTLLLVLGTTAMAWLLPGPRTIGMITFDVHTLLFAGMTILIGFQSINFAAFSKIFAITEGLLPEDRRLNKLFRYMNLETGLIAGAVLVLVGLGTWIFGLNYWRVRHFGALDPSMTLRFVIPGLVSLTLGVQT